MCGGHDRRAHGPRFLRRNLYGRAKGEEDGIIGHALDIVWRQSRVPGVTDVGVGPCQDVTQIALFVVRVRIFGNLPPGPIHVDGPVFVERSVPVADDDLPGPKMVE